MSRVAVVTGGASGMGRATVELLRAEGVDVAVFDVAGEATVDVSDAASVAEGVERVHGLHGPVDIVVNAAGIASGGTLGDAR